MAKKKNAKQVALGAAIVLAIVGLVGGYVLGSFFPAFQEGSFLGATRGGSGGPRNNNNRR